jgi:hypothetical protein
VFGSPRKPSGEGSSLASIAPVAKRVDLTPSPSGLPGAGLEPAWGYPRGIFLPATAFAAARAAGAHAFGVWTLPLPYRRATRIKHASGGLGRGRQVSTLSRRPRGPRPAKQGPRGTVRLSSVLQPPRRAAGSPTLTPFTPGVSASGCSISLKSLASTDFATRAWVGADNSTENLSPDVAGRHFSAWR